MAKISQSRNSGPPAVLDSATAIDPRLESIAVDIERLQSDAVLAIAAKLAEAHKIFLYRHDEGGFQGWVERRLTFSRRTAYKLLDVHKQFGGKESVHNVHTLPRSILYLLAAPSTPDEALDEIIKRAEAGETLSTETVKNTIARCRPGKGPRNMKRAGLLRRAKLGDELVDKLKGTSLDRADEMNELIFLNRGAAPGEHTDIVKQLVDDAVAGKDVSALGVYDKRKPRRPKSPGNAVDPQASTEAAAAEGVRAKPADGYMAMVDAWHAATADEQRGMLRFIGADFVEGPIPPTQNLKATWKKRMAFVWQRASRAEQGQLVDFLKVRMAPSRLLSRSPWSHRPSRPTRRPSIEPRSSTIQQRGCHARS